MLDGLSDRRLFSSAELHQLRQEATRLFEQCLTQGDPAPLKEFIEQQLSHQPPRLQLLRELADDLQQRLLSLREYHFDVRDRVIRTLSESYGVDITSLTSPADLHRYHHLTTHSVLTTIQKQTILTDQDTLLIRNMVDASLRMAAQLSSDIDIAQHLYTLVVDWLEGLSVEVIKHHWDQHPRPPDNTDTRLH